MRIFASGKHWRNPKFLLMLFWERRRGTRRSMVYSDSYGESSLTQGHLEPVV